MSCNGECSCEENKPAPITMTITCDLTDPDGRDKAYHIAQIDRYVMGYYDLCDLNRKLFNDKEGEIEGIVESMYTNENLKDAIPMVRKIVDIIQTQIADIIQTSRFHYD